MEKIIIKEKNQIVEAYQKALEKCEIITKNTLEIEDILIDNVSMTLEVTSEPLFMIKQTDIKEEIKRSFWDGIFNKYVYMKVPFTFYKAKLQKFKYMGYEINMEMLEKLEKFDVNKAWLEFFYYNYTITAIDIEDGRNEYGSLTEDVKRVVESFDLFGLIMDGYKPFENRRIFYNNSISTAFLVSGVTYETNYIKIRTFKGNRRKIRLSYTKKLQKYIKQFEAQYKK